MMNDDDKSVKFAPVVESDLKATILIATTPKCLGRAQVLFLDCYTLPLSPAL